jgi:hypothetical protein
MIGTGGGAGRAMRSLGAAALGGAGYLMPALSGQPPWLNALVAVLTTGFAYLAFWVGSKREHEEKRWEHEATMLVLRSKDSAEANAVVLRALLGREDKAA